MSILSLELPTKIGQVLSAKTRYKVLHGGRGSSKSWSVARALLSIGVRRPLLVLCARELQISLVDSVHKLLADQIHLLGLGAYYEIQKAQIIGKEGTQAAGTRFMFSGIKNAKNLKSFEGVDICWVEEAQAVSKESWEILIPTIRRNGSEIWVTFNPEFDDDDTYTRFIMEPSEDTAIAQVNWYDNPWFPDVLLAEKDKLKAKNISAYKHVWEGECITAPDGAVFSLSWFGRYTQIPKPPTRTMVVHSWDTAYKADQHNDPSCCTVWHITPTVYYLANVVHGRFEYPELRKLIFQMADDDKPDAILIEDKASGQSLIQELQRVSRYPVFAIEPEGDKETRARVTSAYVEGGKVLLPTYADWLHEYEREIMLFPPPDGSKAHDDRVDSTSQFLRWINRNGSTSYSDTLRALGYSV